MKQKRKVHVVVSRYFCIYLEPSDNDQPSHIETRAKKPGFLLVQLGTSPLTKADHILGWCGVGSPH